ncbi:hypothetical protein EYF80_005471 [Liparis tanakae]|uniref:Uncharacterized protein n=1 Tax=Liparis tanakae TaxID=230148 RepID=A0A4Z2J2S0_9TELE|nr:hypothetical protein EYF80_005471 [Liparis tanakae]
MGLCSQCFSTALRGLQVVCYGWCLGDGDKAETDRVLQVQAALELQKVMWAVSLSSLHEWHNARAAPWHCDRQECLPSIYLNM